VTSESGAGKGKRGREGLCETEPHFWLHPLPRQGMRPIGFRCTSMVSIYLACTSPWLRQLDNSLHRGKWCGIESPFVSSKSHESSSVLCLHTGPGALTGAWQPGGTTKTRKEGGGWPPQLPAPSPVAKSKLICTHLQRPSHGNRATIIVSLR